MPQRHNLGIVPGFDVIIADPTFNGSSLQVTQSPVTPETSSATTAAMSEVAIVETTENQPPSASLETAPSDISPSGDQQLLLFEPEENSTESSTQQTTTISVTVQNADGQGNTSVSRKRKGQPKDTSAAEDQEFTPDASKPKAKKVKRTAQKTNDNPYGLTPGVTPFPQFSGPSTEDVKKVFDLLSNAYRMVSTQPPVPMPPPSKVKMGCGEVPSVLDAILRTSLSAAVTMESADNMLTELFNVFKDSKEGIGKGSVDWNQVRLRPVEDLKQTISKGGLADLKSRNIKAILDMVYEENIERGAAEQDLLSLEHLRGLPSEEIMMHLTKYPGVGVKTAACILCFCFQMPCFAIDTHVHRIALWLGWVPEKANANDTFKHLEVRCPDRFKYGLHQLFIYHGQNCQKCKAITTEGTKGWHALDDCLLESLILRRIGKRQSKTQLMPKKRNQRKKNSMGNAKGEDNGVKENSNVERERLKDEDEDVKG
ncbi:DNA glycosylase [Annulohypoxylon bovei var. microspora]|nr:DNA glycosylase [Annulohypoxylon bovei var. microspora]